MNDSGEKTEIGARPLTGDQIEAAIMYVTGALLLIVAAVWLTSNGRAFAVILLALIFAVLYLRRNGLGLLKTFARLTTSGLSTDGPDTSTRGTTDTDGPETIDPTASGASGVSGTAKVEEDEPASEGGEVARPAGGGYIPAHVGVQSLIWAFMIHAIEGKEWSSNFSSLRQGLAGNVRNILDEADAKWVKLGQNGDLETWALRNGPREFERVKVLSTLRCHLEVVGHMFSNLSTLSAPTMEPQDPELREFILPTRVVALANIRSYHLRDLYNPSAIVPRISARIFRV